MRGRTERAARRPRAPQGFHGLSETRGPVLLPPAETNGPCAGGRRQLR